MTACSLVALEEEEKFATGLKKYMLKKSLFCKSQNSLNWIFKSQKKIFCSFPLPVGSAAAAERASS